MMKKGFRIILPLVCGIVLFSSCKPKMKQENGHVTYFRQDTIKIMVGGDEKTYLTQGAQFIGGMPMEKDSVEIMRIKDQAHVVRLIPQPGRVIDTSIKNSQPLLTAPAPKGTAEKSKKFVETMKKKQQE